MVQATIYLIRHGQTEANRDNILQGHVNHFPLTEQGIADGVRAGKALQHIPLHALFSSDLNRTRETASLFMQQRKDKNVGPVTGPIETALMRELYFGVREGLPRGTSLAEARRLKPDIAIEDTHIVTSENPSRETIKLSLGDNGGETVESVLARIEGLLAHSHLIAESHHSQQVDAGVDKSESLPCPIVWVTHGGFIRCFLNHFANLSVLQEHAFSAEVSQGKVPKKAEEIHVGNGSVTKVTVSWLGSERTISADSLDHIDNCEVPFPY